MSLPYAHPLFQRISDGEWHPGGAAAAERLWRACLAALRRSGEDAERGLRVLDAGCGPGGTVRRLAARGALAVGLDRVPHAAWREGTPPGAGATPEVVPVSPFFCVADICRVPLPDNWADAVLCQCAASLLPAPESFFAEVARLLRPGGVLGLSDLVRREASEQAEKGPACAAACDHAARSAATPSAAPACPGGCAAGARSREDWEGLVRGAGLRLLAFHDESHELARLAARLVWYGDAADLRELGLCGDAGQGASRPGYGVWLAVREEKPTNREE